MPTPYYPLTPGVLIDPTNESTQLAPFDNFFAGVFEFNGALWAVLFNAISSTVQVATSTDNGATWAILDKGDAPTANDGTWVQDGSTIIVGIQAAAPGTVSFVTFDMIGQAWGVSGIATSPSLDHLNGSVLRNDGSLVLIGNNGGGVGDSGFDVYIWDGTSWSASIDMAAELNAQPWYGGNFGIQNPTYTTDGNTIWFGCSAEDNSNDQVAFAVSLAADNSVGPLWLFPDGDLTTQPANIFPGVQNVNGWPTLVGSTVILPLYVAGPVDYPTLSASFDGGNTYTMLGTPGVDPPAFNSSPSSFAMCHYAPQATSDGTSLYLIYGLLDNSGNASTLRLCVTTPTGNDPATWTWACSDAQDISSMGAGYNQWESPFLLFQSGVPVLLLAATASFDFGAETPMVLLSSFTRGRVHGTFVGFVLEGQFSGGTK